MTMYTYVWRERSPGYGWHLSTGPLYETADEAWKASQKYGHIDAMNGLSEQEATVIAVLTTEVKKSWGLA